MKKTKVPNILIFLFVFCTLIAGVNQVFAHTFSKAKSAVEKEADLTWDNTHVKSKEMQKASIKDKMLTLTTVSIITPGGQKVTQTTQVPIDMLDTARIKSFQHLRVDGIYFLRFYTKNDEKVVRTTTVFDGIEGGEPTQNVVYTSSFTIYTNSKDRSISLRDKFEQLSLAVGE
jgi:hypothetical protein